MKHKPAPPFNGLAQFQIEHGSLGVLGTQRRKRRTLSAIDDTFMLATRSVTAEISMFPDIIHCMRSLDLSLASASSTNPFLAKITKLPRELENFATSRGLKNLNEHGVIMPKQTQLAIDEQQS